MLVHIAGGRALGHGRQRARRHDRGRGILAHKADQLLAGLIAKVSHQCGGGLDVAVDCLLGGTFALARFQKGANEPKLAEKTCESQEIFGRFDLQKERRMRGRWLVRWFG